MTDAFVARYNLDKLVHAGMFDDMMAASPPAREARVQRWRRDWKFAPVEERNPDWQDIAPAMAA